MRNIRADYKAAYIAEYEAYKTAGRDKDAAVVAGILRDNYGHEVDPAPEPEQERADAGPAPENTAQPQAPARTTAAAKKTAAKKTAPAKPQADSK